MTEILVAALVAGLLTVILVLLFMLRRAYDRAIRTVDRVLLLGKSTTPAEAIAMYERLDHIEQARDALLDQRKRAAARGADQNVARKSGPLSWFGHRRRPRAAPTSNGE